jgi:hypothetical protein
VSIVWHTYPPDELSLLDPKPPLVIASELTAEGVREQITFRQAEPEYVWRSVPGGMKARLETVPVPRAPRRWEIPLLVLAAGGIAAASAIGALRRRSRWRWPIGAVVLAFGLAWLPWGRISVPDPFAAGRPLPSASEAEAIFAPLHANLYRAFDFSEESAVYDALAESVDGPLLEELYLTVHRSLVLQDEGGALSRVQAVRREETAIESIGIVHDAPGFVVRCRYQVDGRVTHWGHAHDRTNEYLVRYTIVSTSDQAGRTVGWRITDTEVLEQRRVDGDPVPATLPPALQDGSFEV